MRLWTRVLLGGLTAGTCALAVAVPALAENGPSARAVLRNAAGDTVGRVTFSQRGDKVLVSAMARSLPPEFHGFHVHAVGKCDAPDFTSAGGHLNPTGMNHPSHAGDLPTLLVMQDGSAMVRVATDRFNVSDLLAGGGTAVIVHANRDNQANIPNRYSPPPDAMTLMTGDAGARIACGVVEALSEMDRDDSDED